MLTFDVTDAIIVSTGGIIMEVLWIVSGSLGSAALVVGIVFFFIYRNVKCHSDHVVKGRIIDLTWNAAEFNRIHTDEEYSLDIGGLTFRGEVGGRSYSSTDYRTSNTFHKVFSYTVDGKEYVRAEGIRYSKGLIEKTVGTEVNVYYDPHNPRSATLSSGKGYKIVWAILIPVGIALLITSAVILFLL